MNHIRKLGTVLLMTMMSTGVAAEHFAITEAEILNLEVTTTAPVIAHEVVVAEATARVVIPPIADVVLSAPQGGLLASLTVSVGDKVSKGDGIAKLHSASFVSLQREFLDALNSWQLHQGAFDRDQTLYEEGIISARRLQEATARLKNAAARLNEHRQLLNFAGLTTADIKLLETRQRIVQALLVRAPFDGVILERMVNVGERLESMAPIMRLADVSSLWLEINVPQEKLNGIQSGMNVSVAGVQSRVSAVVTTIGSAVDSATQAVVVRASLVDEKHGLRPGQFVSTAILANIKNPLAEAVWTVPIQAVTRSGETHYLFVRTESGFEARQAVLLGTNGTQAYVDVDIDTNTQIAISGIVALKALWSAQSESGA